MSACCRAHNRRSAHTGMYGNTRKHWMRKRDICRLSLTDCAGKSHARVRQVDSAGCPSGPAAAGAEHIRRGGAAVGGPDAVFGGDSGGSGYLADLWALSSTCTQLKARACVPAVGQ